MERLNEENNSTQVQKSYKKLTKSEWDALEVPVSDSQLNILKMIRDGYHNPKINYNPTFSLRSFMKIDEKSKKNEKNENFSKNDTKNDKKNNTKNNVKNEKNEKNTKNSKKIQKIDQYDLYFFDKYFRKILEKIKKMYEKTQKPVANGKIYKKKIKIYENNKNKEKETKNKEKNKKNEKIHKKNKKNLKQEENGKKEPKHKNKDEKNEKIKIYEKKSKIVIKSADKIRIQNFEKRLENSNVKSTIIEFILLDLFEEYLKSNDWEKKIMFYYTIKSLLNFKIRNINSVLRNYLDDNLETFKTQQRKREFFQSADKYIEQNQYLPKYKDITLYEHQRLLFNYCKAPRSKLIFYQSPTGTGKTISPIGLVAGGKHKMIFVCAAKHVGLQLAKCCISMEIPIALAFGCQDPGDVRLHYFAAKEFTRNRYSGGFFRVEHEVGDKVEIIISDIQSYLPAMNYLLAFQKPENIIWFWDEPTISLDYDDHPYHEVIRRNWQENEIPNIVLSSATLPDESLLEPCISKMREKFPLLSTRKIQSRHCEKTIPILDKNNYPQTPHRVFDDKDEFLACVPELEKCPALYRHFDLRELINFILWVNSECMEEKLALREPYKLENYFDEIEDITALSIKDYYVCLLKRFAKKIKKTPTLWQELCAYKNESIYKKKAYHSTIKIVTEDAYTITDGPAIYLANDVNKIGDFCVKLANIPENITTQLIEKIQKNNSLIEKIMKLEKEMMKNTDASKMEGFDKKKESSGGNQQWSKNKQVEEKIRFLRDQLSLIRLDPEYMPNAEQHLDRWGHEWTNLKKGQLRPDDVWKADIGEEQVKTIMLMNVPLTWKSLVIMGIGMFIEEEENEDVKAYMEIVKALAEEQKLFMIIASSDYIYGMNYQFCHGYIGKDLAGMTREKMIQALGRVGRQSTLKKYSVRLRDNEMAKLVFAAPKENKEADNMNRLMSLR